MPSVSAPDLHDLATHLVRSTGATPEPFSLHVLTTHDPHAELARSVEREVFLEFFGNTAELLATEYGDYEASSLFLCVIDRQRGVPAGAMRMILPSAAGFKSLLDLETVWGEPAPAVMARSRVDPDLARVWDVATLAVVKDYRGHDGGLVSLAMYQALAMLATMRGVTGLVAILDLVVLDLIQSRLGRPFAPFHGLEPRRYLDSPWSMPVYLDVADYRARLQFLDPDLHRLVFGGQGLEAAVARPGWDDACLAAVS